MAHVNCKFLHLAFKIVSHASSWRRLKVCTNISRVVRYNVGEKEGDVCPVLYDYLLTCCSVPRQVGI